MRIDGDALGGAALVLVDLLQHMSDFVAYLLNIVPHFY